MSDQPVMSEVEIEIEIPDGVDVEEFVQSLVNEADVEVLVDVEVVEES